MVKLEQTRQAWEEFAGSYDEHVTPLTTLGAEAALRMAGVSAGVRLLDIASGGGALAIPAADMGAEVLAVDYAAAMVELLRHKAERLGLRNLRVRQMDGTALDLESGSFDFACSSLGIMLFPDRALGLREMARVLRAGGKGVMVAFAAPDRVQPVSLFVTALANTLPDFIPPGDSPLFSLMDLEVLRRELQDAGFMSIQVKEAEFEVEVGSADHLWQLITSGAPAIAGPLRGLAEEQKGAVRRELSRLLEARDSSSGTIKLPFNFNIGIGRTPTG